MTLNEAISELVEGRPLSREAARDAMRVIMAGEATPAQIGAYLVALRIRGESPEVIAGSAEAMREKFTPVPTPPDAVVVDTCGTGGDGSGTFNISTAVALVAAGAGLVVAKHGNRGVSSRSGSADVLAALGVNTAASPEGMAACLAECGIAFLFAPALHPAMKHAIGPRRELGLRTVFNILGPLCNPAGARRGLLGVYAADLVPVIARAALDLGAEHLFVVHGLDGLDEISLGAPTRVAEVRDGRIREFETSPEEVGLARCAPEALAGGSPEENADLIRELLAGRRPGPPEDIVALNAAAVLVAGGLAPDLRAGIGQARQVIADGGALRKLEALVACSHAPA